MFDTLQGEASPAYMYSLPAAHFFLQPNMRMARLLLLLRRPTDRAVSEFEHKKARLLVWSCCLELKPLGVAEDQTPCELCVCGT